MSALTKAIEEMERVEGGEFVDGMFVVAKAQAYAAIAQAEQMKRVANALENWMSVQGVLPEFFEYIERAKLREADDGVQS